VKLSRIAFSGAVAAAVLVPFSASSQPAPLVDPVRLLEPRYQQREALAPPNVRARLQRSRAAAATARHSTAFAYTAVSDAPLKSITGYVEPADPIARMQAHNTKHAAAITRAASAQSARIANARAKMPARVSTGGHYAQAAQPNLPRLPSTIDMAKQHVAAECSAAPTNRYACADEQAYRWCLVLLRAHQAGECAWIGHPEALARFTLYSLVVKEIQNGCAPIAGQKEAIECWDKDDYEKCSIYWRGTAVKSCAYEPPASLTFQTLPPRFDWRAAHVVPPIRDQRRCGSCWAFAAVGTLEIAAALEAARVALIDGKSLFQSPYKAWTVDYAEQEILSCSGGGDCSLGGDYQKAFAWMTTHAMYTESSDYYQAKDLPCESGTSSGVKVALYAYVDPTVLIPSQQKLKAYLVQYGPLAITMYATDAFQDYAGGVFQGFAGAGPWGTKQPDGRTNHAVVLVGYDDALGAWIIRNSWGEGWGTSADFTDAYRKYGQSETMTDFAGERGYAYVAYDTLNVGAEAMFVVPSMQ